jgi:hypothetical protein
MVEKPLQQGLRAVHHFWYYRPDFFGSLITLEKKSRGHVK